MFYRFFSFLIILTILDGCEFKQEKYFWPADGTTLSVVKFKLGIEDSSKILIEHNDSFSLFSPDDSLIISEFKINYNYIEGKSEGYFNKIADRKVTNTANRNVTEYYKFDKGNVFLVGYTTSNATKPYTVFQPPLNISPSLSELKNGEVKSEGTMKTFLSDSADFDKGFKTKLRVSQLDTLSILDKNNVLIKCFLRVITFSRDATVGFSGTDLIVPEAILLRSKLLIDETGNPIAEWRIKAEKVENYTAEPDKMQERKLFIELTKYYKQKSQTE